MQEKISRNPSKKKEKKTDEFELPSVTEIEIPNPTVPNRAYTEMALGSDGRSGLSDAASDRD